MPGDNSLVSLLWMFLCVIAIIVLAYVFTRYVVGRSSFGVRAGDKRGLIQVVAQQSVGRDRQILLVKVAERYLLLGCTASEITCLAELTAEQIDAWSEQNSPSDGDQPPSFMQSLQIVLKQKGKR